MLSHFIAVVQSALPTAVVVALLFVTVRRFGGEARGAAWVLWGIVVGAAGAVVLSVLRYATAVVNREYVNLVAFSVALVFGAVLLWSLWRPARRLPRGTAPKTTGLPQPVRPVVPAVLAGALIFIALPDVLLSLTEFVVAGESAISTTTLLRVIGYLLGLLLVVLSALALYRASRDAGPMLLRVVLTVVVVVTMLAQIVAVLAILLARNMIPVQPWIFAVVVWGLNNETAAFFAVLAVSAVLPIMAWRAGPRPPTGYANPAELRTVRARELTRRRFCGVVLTGYVLAGLSVTVLRAYNERGPVLSPAEPVVAEGAEIAVPLERINDGHLHRFAYSASDGTEVRFIVIKKNAFAYGVGLDACLICGASGYAERDGKVVCTLCDVVMNTATIGFRGGCNPIPLAHTVAGGSLVVRAADLEDSRSVFA